MPLPSELDRRLADLEAKLLAMIAAYRTDGEFWMAFTGEADVIEDAAGEHAALVYQRLQAMLALHGRYIATTELPPA